MPTTASTRPCFHVQTDVQERKRSNNSLVYIPCNLRQAQLVFVIPEKSPTFATNKGSLSLLWCVCLWPVCSKSLVKSSMVFFKLALLTCPPSPVEIPTIVILGRRGFGGNWLTDSPSELSVLVKERGVKTRKTSKGYMWVKMKTRSLTFYGLCPTWTAYLDFSVRRMVLTMDLKTSFRRGSGNQGQL